MRKFLSRTQFLRWLVLGGCLITPLANAMTTTNLVVNGDAENGTTGWTVVSGLPQSINAAVNFGFAAAQGTFYFAGQGFSGGTSPGTTLDTMSQTIDVSSMAADIALGTATFDLTAQQTTWNGSDIPVLQLEAFDALNVSLGTWNLTDNSSRSWMAVAASASVPVTTDHFVLTVGADHRAGTDNDGYTDDISLTLTTPMAGGTCDTFGDNFNATSYANQDGTANWAANWVEFNDNGIPNSGDILIQGNRLRIKDDNRAISRTADLSAYTSATLTFDYQETGYDNSNDSIDIQVRGGGNGWQTLQSFVGSAVNSGSANITIPTGFIANDFELRFITSAFTGNNDNFRVDNLELEGCSGGAATCNVADNFNNVAYNQNDGADNWVGDWLEVAESNGPSAGIARVRNDNCTAGNCLRLGVPSGGGAQTYNGIGVRREVDLSGASSAELDF